MTKFLRRRFGIGILKDSWEYVEWMWNQKKMDVAVAKADWPRGDCVYRTNGRAVMMVKAFKGYEPSDEQKAELEGTTGWCVVSGRDIDCVRAFADYQAEIKRIDELARLTGHRIDLPYYLSDEVYTTIRKMKDERGTA